MNPDFWHERWQRQEIGFHQAEINPYLRQYWPELQVTGGTVFVPLCGKSLDMVWLREQGHEVLGVELSPLAVQGFFAEHGHTLRHSADERFKRCEANGIQLLCGDFFDLAAADLAQVTAVYDRAALIALPPELRARYVRHLVSLLPAGAQILLVTVDYLQEEMTGPPFAVSGEEVEALYRPYADIELLARLDVLAQNPRFQARGMSRLYENIFRLKLR
jgi:thiopurine S-methyltransferase